MYKFKNKLNISINETDYIFYLGLAIFVIMLGALTKYLNLLIIPIALCLIFLILFSKNPLLILSLFILVSPFSATYYLKDSLFDIPGLKPIQVLGILIIVIGSINLSNSVKISKNMVYLSIAIIIIFTLSFLRSIKFLPLFNEYYFTADKLSTTRYILSEYIKPLMYFIPFIIILKFVKSEKEIDFIMNVICLTLFILSVTIIYLYMFNIKNKTDIGGVTEYYSEFFNIHRNEIASFYIIGLPIVLKKYFFDKKKYSIILIIIMFFAIGVTFSRGAYLSTLLALFSYYLISKRNKVMIIVITIIVTLPIIMYKPIMERGSHGLQQNDTEKISAGRIDDIWLPLIKEYATSPEKLIFGNGRYAVMSSDAASKQEILKNIMHPHNMYLEIILDAGLIGFIVFIAFYYSILKMAIINIFYIKDERLKTYIYPCTISIMCFLVSGITDRSLFPKADTMFIWIITSLTIVSCNMANNADLKTNL